MKEIFKLVLRGDQGEEQVCSLEEIKLIYKDYLGKLLT
jgi:hypothetical protein